MMSADTCECVTFHKLLLSRASGQQLQLPSVSLRPGYHSVGLLTYTVRAAFDRGPNTGFPGSSRDRLFSLWY